jgi:hypothetical protein
MVEGKSRHTGRRGASVVATFYSSPGAGEKAPRPSASPINYPALFQDAIILASVSNAVKQISDESVRKSVLEGVSAGFKAAQKHAGGDVTINGQVAHAA